jgi:hypothetical protein
VTGIALVTERSPDRSPMMAYVGQTRSTALIAELEQHGIGECVVTGELPARRPRFFHDSGAYREWQSGRPFNVCRWERDMRWMSYRGIVPDFVVVPDIVAGGSRHSPSRHSGGIVCRPSFRRTSRCRTV